jgi:hypothetical protein
MRFRSFSTRNVPGRSSLLGKKERRQQEKQQLQRVRAVMEKALHMKVNRQ